MMEKIYICLVLLISCTNTDNINDSKEDSKLNEIVVETIIDKKINLSEICSAVSYVKLESNERNTIGSIDKMIIHDNKFYIHDSKTMKIFIFDFNGNYIFQISKNGRGPGEYVNLEDFLVDSASNKIEILDDATQKVLIYDNNGNFVSEKKYSFWPDQFCKLSENSYLYFFNNYLNQPSVEESYNVMILDSIFKVKNLFLPIGNLLGLKVGEENCLQKYGKGANVVIPYDCDHIYYVTEYSSSIKYKINFVNFVMPDNFFYEYFKVDKSNRDARSRALIQFIHKLNEGNSYVTNMINVFEHSKYFSFQYRVSYKGIFTVFLNKSTGEIQTGIPENDIDYGLYGTPLFILKDTLFTYFTAHDIIERTRFIDSMNLPVNSQYSKLKQFTQLIDLNDNPIIARFILK